MLNRESVLKAYHRYAPVYWLVFGWTLEPGRGELIRCIHPAKGDKVLEIGVGTGLMLPHYPPGIDLTGIDLSKDMLRHATGMAQQLGLFCTLREMDAQQLDFPDARFDKVLAPYVASVVPDPKAMVREMKRVCKKGGDLYFINHFESHSSTLSHVERILEPLSGLMGFTPVLNLDAFIKENDLKVESLQRANFFGYWRLIHAKNI